MTLKITTLTAELRHPWALAFLPDGRLLVTERRGRLRVLSVSGDKAQLSEPIEGVPEVAAGGQGGLLDIILDRDYVNNHTVYFSFSEPGNLPDGTAGASTAVASARFENDRLQDVKVIFRQTPKAHGSAHFGSRIVQADDGSLFVTLGERYILRELAQDLSTHLGKVLRIRPDGSVPPDNPFVGKPDAKPEIWSYGHRNMQGAALHPVTRLLWTHEHGAQGGDEVNVERAGNNYGWPVITLGIDYNGDPISEGKSKPGMEQPIHFWVPSIAPSGMAFYTGGAFPAWQGNLLVGSLKFEQLVRLELDGEKVLSEERIALNAGRIRDVRQGADGKVYVLTDSWNGRLMRLEPTS